MAKFIETYELHLQDEVEFRVPCALPGNPHNCKILRGTVQSLEEFPEIWVEVGDPKSSEYKRYKITPKLIENVCTDEYLWRTSDVKFEKNEPLEFVYNEDYTRNVISKHKTMG